MQRSVCKLCRGILLDGEKAILRNDTGRNMTWIEPIVPPWVKGLIFVPGHLTLSRTSVYRRRILFVLLHRKIQSYERVESPIQQSCLKAMMLRDRK